MDATRQVDLPLPAPSADSRIIAALGMIATLAALAFGTSLAVRPICSNDIGYHLAYGEHFLDTGKIVQTNQFIFTRIENRPRDPGNLGPGCWYDADGTYHFINANWLSQVIIAYVHRAGGMNGLVYLQAALAAGMLLLIVVTCRRARLAWHWTAGVVMLVSFCFYERFLLRPENFGQIILAAQFCLVMERRFTWPKAAAVVVLQLLAVNVHSYFLLGNALTCIFFGEAAARRLWLLFTGQPAGGEVNGRLIWTAAAVAGCFAADLANPWFFRGAIMPLQTLAFLDANHISRASNKGVITHPWATIGEFAEPFTESFSGTRATAGYRALLYVSAAAAVAMLALMIADAIRHLYLPEQPATPSRTRSLGSAKAKAAPIGPPLLAWLVTLGMMVAVSFNLRRNIAPAGLIAAPLALLALKAAWDRLSVWRPVLRDRVIHLPVGLAAALAATLAGVWWTSQVVNQQFYVSERRSWRFGLGASTFNLPMDAAEWINANRPAGNLFADFNQSSNIMYFTNPHRPVPVLTNTWAYPPYVMQWAVNVPAGRVPFDQVVAQYDMGMVLLQPGVVTAPLVKSLSESPDWALVQVTPRTVLFVRRSANAELARRCELTRERFDVAQYIRQSIASDPGAPAFALHNAALSLLRLGWAEPAEAVWRECLRLKGDYHEAMSTMALCLALGGTDKMLEMQKAIEANQDGRAQRLRSDGWAKWTEAMGLLDKALALRPDYQEAQANRDRLREQMDAFQHRHEILVPHW